MENWVKDGNLYYSEGWSIWKTIKGDWALSNPNQGNDVFALKTLKLAKRVANLIENG